MTTIIENNYKATKSYLEATKNELLLSQARLGIKIIEKIEKENASVEITRLKGTDGAECTWSVLLLCMSSVGV